MEPRDFLDISEVMAKFVNSCTKAYSHPNSVLFYGANNQYRNYPFTNTRSNYNNRRNSCNNNNSNRYRDENNNNRGRNRHTYKGNYRNEIYNINISLYSYLSCRS